MYRIDPPTGRCDIVADDFDRPNGLAFSLDESQLYIGDSRAKHIRVFDVDGGRLSGGRCSPTAPTARSTACASTTPVACGPPPATASTATTPDGTLIGKMLLPEETANLVFGGPKRNRLFVAATTSVYSILLSVSGAVRCGRRRR